MLKNMFKSLLITLFIIYLATLSKDENSVHIIFILIFLSSIICAIISSYLKIEKYNKWYSMSPAGVLFFTSVLWFIFFPIYVFVFLQIKETKKDIDFEEDNSNEVQKAISVINNYEKEKNKKINYNKICASHKILDKYIKESKITGDEKQEILQIISKARKMEKKIEERTSTISCGVIIILIIIYNVVDYFTPAEIKKSALWYLPETPQELKENGYQKTLDKCGIEAIKRSNALLAPAADIVSKNKECDKIILVMQDDRGACKDNVEIIVDCENSTRFILNEREIKTNSSVKSLNSKMNDKLPQYLNDCETAIKLSLTRPATYKLISRDYRVTATTTLIDIKFSSQNGIGLPIEAIGHCDFDDKKMTGFRIEQ